jgi:hypothetical protein
MFIFGPGSPISSWSLLNKINSSGGGLPINNYLRHWLTVRFFHGQCGIPGALTLCKARALPTCKSFIWLSLATRPVLDGWNAMASPTMASESIGHLLITCVYSRETWFRLLSVDGMRNLVPSADAAWPDWWLQSRLQVAAAKRKAFDTLVVLTCWRLLRERNARVFDGR